MKYSTDLLPETEIRELVRRYQAGDRDVAAAILQNNEGAIRRIAERYHVTGACGDQELDDLLQWGRMGLLYALDKFDLDRGNKFLSYAWYWIRLYISRNARHDGQRVGYSYKAAENKVTVGRAHSRLVQANRREPTSSELADATGLPVERVRSLHIKITSLDAYLDAEEADDTLADVILDPDADTALDGEQQALLAEAYSRMQRLTARERQIVNWTFGLGDGQPLSLREIAGRLNISPERVRQIQEAALYTIREEPLFDTSSCH